MKKYEVQLCMRRKLDNLNETKIPKGYEARSYKPGDSGHWEEIINLAFDRDNMSFSKSMRTDPSFRAERVIFICKDDVPVATASAWYKPEWGKKTGYLHMVGTHPGHTGSGLGLQASLAALNKMESEGREDAVLLTDDFRIPAIKTYLRLGFEPLLIHEDQRKRWQDIFNVIGKPELMEKFKGCLEAALFNDEDPKKDMDYPARYPIGHKWHPNRPHRLGTGQTDALGDESLYKPSKLGMATISPKTIKAASRAPLQITYTAGEVQLSKGAKVVFYICGQGTLSRDTSLRNNGRETDSSSVIIKSNGNCEMKALSLGFEITEGTLSCGEQVALLIDDFDWTPIAGRYEIKVIITTSSDEPQMRLPEPLVINVEPLEISNLSLLLPFTYKQGTLSKLRVTTRDIFDNRVPYNGQITIWKGTSSENLHIINGYAETTCMFSSGETEIIKADFHNKSYESNPCVCSEDLQLYAGDLHVHDFLSAAHGSTGDVYEWGRYDKNLDFISVAVQNHGWISNDKWTIAKHMNEKYHRTDEYITFLANEWQHSAYGDKVIHFMGGDQPYFTTDDRRTDSPAKLYEAVRGSDAFVVSHHPAYNREQWCGGTYYDELETDVERLIELWSMHGSSEGFISTDRPLKNMDYDNTVKGALQKGLRVGFAGGSDTHSGRPGGSAKEPRPYWGGLTAVWATDKSRRSIFKALYARHTYALTGERIVLRFTVNEAFMGSEIPASDKALIKVSAKAPLMIRTVQIMKNADLLDELRVDDFSADIVYEDKSEKGDFYHCRVVLAEGSLAVCSPVWLG